VSPRPTTIRPDAAAHPDAGPPELSLRALSLLRAVLAEGPGRLAHLAVRGQCMEPLLRDGDVVTVVPVRRRPRLGWVVVARGPVGEPVCHRIVGFAGDGCRLAGDASWQVELVPREAIVGRVVEIRREGRLLRLGGAIGAAVDAVLAGWHRREAHGRRSRWLAVRLVARGGGRVRRAARGAWARCRWMTAGYAIRPDTSAGTASRSAPAASDQAGTADATRTSVRNLSGSSAPPGR